MIWAGHACKAMAIYMIHYWILQSHTSVMECVIYIAHERCLVMPGSNSEVVFGKYPYTAHAYRPRLLSYILAQFIRAERWDSIAAASCICKEHSQDVGGTFRGGESSSSLHEESIVPEMLLGYRELSHYVRCWSPLSGRRSAHNIGTQRTTQHAQDHCWDIPFVYAGSEGRWFDGIVLPRARER